MTRLIVYPADAPKNILFESGVFDVIIRELDALGVRFERWSASRPLEASASPEDILAAYAPEVERLKSERGYTAADVVRVKPGAPNWPELRQKFLVEHTHDDDEVRFFVEGSGSFYLHVGDRVIQVIGVAGDLLSVPRETPHWFDGGEFGDFTAIRLFTRPDGWVAHYTGAPIADGFPRHKKAA
jgi:1,2-dihydroxy-3-keto-5-methylthiopentene dioxygenase